ncbi:SphA family protein [Tunturiibacter lichenicola]|uniref:SphA family protein n=1 Tax=Tunturiibacter lichenicola TaxID=2051959 RepID=UPI0021B36E83|nr:transporter [Edaphobacter lichenicola]
MLKPLQPVLFMILIASTSLVAQTHVAEPAVNLGDTSFLDGLGGPGGVVEEIGDGAHEGTVVDGSGSPISGTGAVNSISGLTHIAWLSHKTILGGWYGTEVVAAAAHVNAGSTGQSGGWGALTVSPLILQWGERKIGNVPIDQRVVFDFDLPVGAYTRSSVVNISANAFTVHPYYAITAFPIRRVETSWRVHYLWNSTNDSPPYATGAQSTQAGPAIHFNATAAYNFGKHLWIGPNAYYLRQITDGRIDSVSLRNSPEQVGAIGPGMVWNSGKWFFYANGYHEFGVKNRPEGNKLVLRVEKTF